MMIPRPGMSYMAIPEKVIFNAENILLIVNKFYA